MRYGHLTFALAGILLVTPAPAAPELVGFFATGSKSFVGLRDAPNKGLAWHSVGDRFGEYEVVSFDLNAETVRLKHGSTFTDLKLKASRVESAPTVALVEQLASNGDSAMQKLLPALRSLDSRRAQAAAELSAMEVRAHSDEEARRKLPDARRLLTLQEENLGFLLRAVVRSKPLPDK